MSDKKHFTLQVDHLLDEQQTPPQTTSSGKCEINVQVANGWAITGHYQNNTLQTITLRKTMEAVGK